MRQRAQHLASPAHGALRRLPSLPHFRTQGIRLVSSPPISEIGLASSNVPMPLAGLLHDHLLAAVAKGRGDLDWTGLAGEVSEAAGLRPPPSAESNPRADGGS